MRDGINIAKSGLPSVALVTEDFWPQGEFVANSLGMPSAPRVRLPHPVAGTGKVNLERIAKTVVDEIVDQLAGAN